jgi:hypothetical protein
VRIPKADTSTDLDTDIDSGTYTYTEGYSYVAVDAVGSAFLPLFRECSHPHLSSIAGSTVCNFLWLPFKAFLIPPFKKILFFARSSQLVSLCMRRNIFANTTFPL